MGLRSFIKQKNRLIKTLIGLIRSLRKDLRESKLKIAEFETRLAKYENLTAFRQVPKNSNNSSIPPSKDENRPKRLPAGEAGTKSQRTKSNRKPGGQKGHKGSKLNMVTNPTHIVTHNIQTCKHCSSLLPETSEQYESRQVFDIPPITIEVTEHRAIKKTCKNCGQKSKASFPENLTQKAQYGDRIKALTIYLQNYQMLPFARCSELIQDLFGHKLSKGSLSNFQEKCYHALEDYEQYIKDFLLAVDVLHGDETGVKVKIGMDFKRFLALFYQSSPPPESGSQNQTTPHIFTPSHQEGRHFFCPCLSRIWIFYHQTASAQKVNRYHHTGRF